MLSIDSMYSFYKSCLESYDLREVFIINMSVIVIVITIPLIRLKC